MQPASRPLDGITVVEAGQLLAGPFAATLLGWFGAEVIKLEAPGRGDPLRGWRHTRNGTSLWWWSHARNKQSVTLDLRREQGQAIARELLMGADVLVENFRPGQMERWGLGPDNIRPLNRDLVYTRVSGYGQTGPLAGRAGFASVCEAFGGLRYVNGVPGEVPVRANLSLGDTLAGLHAALGTVLALLHRLRGAGAGQVVDVSIFESVFNMLEGVVPEYSGAGVVREPSGTTITGIVPSSTFRCRDGRLLVIGANTDSMYVRLMNAIERTDLADDPALQNNAGRVAAQARIDEAIASWAGGVEMETALDVLSRAAVAAGPIYDVAQMFEDPHYRARELFERVVVDGGAALDIPAMHPRLGDTPGRTDTPGPTLGQHTDTVLRDRLGYAPEHIADLRAAGIV